MQLLSFRATANVTAHIMLPPPHLQWLELLLQHQGRQHVRRPSTSSSSMTPTVLPPLQLLPLEAAVKV